ncbi:hypothetical protein [Clostridium sp.]|uniref:hypothetical protein n=1 Tax=Clostridium sp. TaxID=1506 RepID=UPI001A5889E0|nr:hypothetical protein [Clostridium sp.]MBK5243163.1 hypothetical protein [Clostridium sp.]
MFKKITYTNEMEILFSEANLVCFSGTVLADGVVANADGRKYVEAGSFIDATGAVVVETVLAEVATLDLSGTVTTAGTVTVTLDGVAYNVAVALSDTASIVADKIKATVMTGWTLSGTSPQVIFTSNTTGIKTDTTYGIGTSAGVTGIVTTTIQGSETETLTTTPVGVLYQTVDVTNGDSAASIMVEGYLRADRVFAGVASAAVVLIKAALTEIKFR